jgi:hypothetical protein
MHRSLVSLTNNWGSLGSGFDSAYIKCEACGCYPR